MTFPSLEGEDVDGYANRVADQWKVKGDRALILLVFIRDHKIAIRTGYSLEADVTDAVSSRVIRETMAPYFRQEQYYEGLDAAVNELGRRINPNYSPQSRSLPTSSSRRGRASGSSQLAPRDLIFLLVLVFVFLVVIAPIMRRSGCGGCGGCFWPMMFLGGGGGRTFGGGGGGGGGGWNVGGSWGGGGGSSFGGGGASGGW
jgi:uncharacterized protein